MAQQQLETFTDRREAIALFNHLRGRNSSKPWPMLPVLAFIAPGGSGKSTLIEYLRIKELKGYVPSAHLDFTLASTPKDFLQILINIRDQLQRQNDGQGKHLTFPRFDLGAALAQATPSQHDLTSFSPSELQQKLSTGKQAFTSLATLGSSLHITAPFVAPLLAALQLAEQIRPLQDILASLENSAGWSWYRMHGTETGLPSNADIKAVLRRLLVLSQPGTPERDNFVRKLLPAALIADIQDVLVDTNPPRSWSNTTNIILFLDGFESLLATSSSAALRLLQVLSVEPYKAGQLTPLLLLVGSRDRLPALTISSHEPSFEQQTVIQAPETISDVCRGWHERWQQQLPGEKRFLRLTDLYLPVELSDFGDEDTYSYLEKIDKREQATLFAMNEPLIHAIERATHGQPLYLALAAAAVIEAHARGQMLTPVVFENLYVSPEIEPDHEHERIGDYLLKLFLRQLPDTEQKELIFCAVARSLNVKTFRAVLHLPNDIEAHERWERYSRFTFIKATDPEHLVFHPIVRSLLLRQLPPSRDTDSDYIQMHTRLRDHFHTESQGQGLDTIQQAKRDYASIEEAYHALALGDPQPAINVGVFAQQNLVLWTPLLEAVAQAPAFLASTDLMQQAGNGLLNGNQRHRVRNVVTAIISYLWLISIVQDDLPAIAALQCNIGSAFSQLPGGDRKENLHQAIKYYEKALLIYTRETFPIEWATTLNNLGNAYCQLPTGNKVDNLHRAIQYFEDALQVRTLESFPNEWAITQNNLGNAYRELTAGNIVQSLGKAVACYEAALQVRTRDAFPLDWAKLQNNLGAVYLSLPGADPNIDLHRAITCFEAALEVRTRETFPLDWASTQNNLGVAYNQLSTGNREENLQRAISYYEAALQVRTREEFPFDWGNAQNNLGMAYSQLPTNDRAENLFEAIERYQAALQVFTCETFPFEWSMVQGNLGDVYCRLPTGNQEENLQRAISYYVALLSIRTYEAFPLDWAKTQMNLGTVYFQLSGENQDTYLQQAIDCYEAALLVYSYEAFPLDWARIQSNLGLAYLFLAGEGQDAYLQQAIVCYEAALLVFTREDFPLDWAKAHSYLGDVYKLLSSGIREKNLRNAITHYESSLQIFNRETSPVDRAKTQFNMGVSYCMLAEGDRQTNLERAKTCYTEALQIYQTQHMEDEAAAALHNLATLNELHP